MKRFCLFVLAICVSIAASACSYPVSYQRDDPDVKWGDAPAPSISAAPEPTEFVPLPTPKPTPTPEPTPKTETVTDVNLTLPFVFGERAGQYSGEMVNGLPDGNGTFTAMNDEGVKWTYIGGWKAGHFNGMGATSWDDGFSESGMYQNDYLNGQGKEGWYGKIQYEGNYLDSEYHGLGTYYNNYSEIVYTGNFNNGLIQESAADRADRVGAFKDQSVPLDIGDLYGSCQEEVSMRVETKGDVLQVICYPSDTRPAFCDILVYEGGVHNTERIIWVLYLLSEGEALPVEGQKVTVWGTTEYLYTYTSLENEVLTVPLLEAWSVE